MDEGEFHASLDNFCQMILGFSTSFRFYGGELCAFSGKGRHNEH
jgi:hypothetical protein